MKNEIQKQQAIMTVSEAWAQLPAALNGLRDSLATAGRIVAYLLDNDENARDKFRALGIAPGVYRRLEMVGRGTLLPELANEAQYARLPLDEQRKVLQGTVEAVVEKPDGSYDVIKVDLLRAEPEIAYRVLASDHLRTPAEQRQVIELSKRRVAALAQTESAERPPWIVSGREIRFTRPCSMTRKDLLAALRALEA